MRKEDQCTPLSVTTHSLTLSFLPRSVAVPATLSPSLALPLSLSLCLSLSLSLYLLAEPSGCRVACIELRLQPRDICLRLHELRFQGLALLADARGSPALALAGRASDLLYVLVAKLRHRAHRKQLRTPWHLAARLLERAQHANAPNAWRTACA